MMKDKIFFLKKESSRPKDNKGNHAFFKLNPLPSHDTTITTRDPVAVANFGPEEVHILTYSFDIVVVTRCQC